MIRWERIIGGVRKDFNWGYSEVYMPNVEDCFTKEELEQVILELSKLPIEALSEQDKELVSKAINKRKKETER